MQHVELLIVGGGAAGICAAKAAYEAGCRSLCLVERKGYLGGVLPQCVHHGFGAGETGGFYAQRLLAGLPEEIPVLLRTSVLSVSAGKIACLSGGKQLSFSRLILATGCMELPMGALPIAGTRPSGVYTAGQMQEMMNLYGVQPQGPAVILGSGDIGLIMAGQLAEEGLSVTLVEQKNRCGGLVRNQKNLRQYPIHLLCGQTIVSVAGDPQIDSCVLSGGERLSCKLLLIAAGLRPDRALTEHLENLPWLTYCGNCNKIHPMIEGVCAEAALAGRRAAQQTGGL